MILHSLGLAKNRNQTEIKVTGIACNCSIFTHLIELPELEAAWRNLKFGDPSFHPEECNFFSDPSNFSIDVKTLFSSQDQIVIRELLVAMGKTEK